MDSVVLRPVSDKEMEVAEHYHVLIGKFNFWIMSGFRTDGASIGSILWMMLCTPFDPEVVDGAVPHDYAYRNPLWWESQGYNRKDADQMMRMINKNQPRWKRNIIYHGLRAGGWVVYNRNKKKALKAQEKTINELQ